MHHKYLLEKHALLNIYFVIPRRSTEVLPDTNAATDPKNLLYRSETPPSINIVGIVRVQACASKSHASNRENMYPNNL